MKNTFPPAILPKHLAILGMTGSGKSTTARDLVEQVVPEGSRVCILDTVKSDWKLFARKRALKEKPMEPVKEGTPPEPLWRTNEKIELARLRAIVLALAPFALDPTPAYQEMAAFTAQAMLAGLTAKSKLNALIQLLRDGEIPTEQALAEQNAVELRIIHDQLLKQATTPAIATASSMSEALRR